MGNILQDMLGANVLQTLKSTSDPKMIHDKNVAQAAKDLVQTIKSLELYPSHQAIVDRFDVLQKRFPTLYSHRTSYLWRMSQACLQLTSLNLPSAYFLQSNVLKCHAALVTILLDDVCDMGHDKAIFDKCVLALEGNIIDDNDGLYRLIADTWAICQKGIENAPNYSLLADTVKEAYRLWLASFEYSLAIQQKEFRFQQTWQEHLEKIAHSSMLYFGGVIDLLFMPNLSSIDMPSALRVFSNTQNMTQLIDWIITWKRELKQRDFTSGVFSMVCENGWVEWDDLQSGNIETIIEQIQNSPMENNLWHEWERLRSEAHQIVQGAKLSVLDGYIDSFSAFMFMLVASTGAI